MDLEKEWSKIPECIQDFEDRRKEMENIKICNLPSIYYTLAHIYEFTYPNCWCHEFDHPECRCKEVPGPQNEPKMAKIAIDLLTTYKELIEEKKEKLHFLKCLVDSHCHAVESIFEYLEKSQKGIQTYVQYKKH